MIAGMRKEHLLMKGNIFYKTILIGITVGEMSLKCMIMLLIFVWEGCVTSDSAVKELTASVMTEMNSQ